MNTEQLINEAVLLPVEERALVIDSLLRSLNTPESALDDIWAEEAKRRLDELRSGRLEGIPGDEVIEQVWVRYGG